MDTIGKRIKYLRTRVGNSQEDLGIVIGVPRSSISKIEHDKANLSTKRAIEIANHFDVSANWLLFGNEQGRLDELEIDKLKLAEKIGEFSSDYEVVHTTKEQMISNLAAKLNSDRSERVLDFMRFELYLQQSSMDDIEQEEE